MIYLHMMTFERSIGDRLVMWLCELQRLAEPLADFVITEGHPKLTFAPGL